MEYHNSADTGPLVPQDTDDEMSDAGDGDGDSQYHSATERQLLSPHPDTQAYGELSRATQNQSFSSTQRGHTPLFLGGSSDTSFDAQWETDSTRSEYDKPESDRMSTPRAPAQSLPREEDEVMAAFTGEEQMRDNPVAYQPPLDESFMPGWEEVERPMPVTTISTMDLPSADWGKSDDGNTSVDHRPSTEGKRRADDDDDDATANPRKRKNEGKRHIAEMMGWMSSRQATRQTATVQVQMERQFKADRAELKNLANHAIRKLQGEKASLEERLAERERELLTVVRTMEVKDQELEERATQFSKERKALEKRIEELEKSVANLRAETIQKERQWAGKREALEDTIARSKMSYENKIKHVHEDAMKSIQEQDCKVREEIRSLREGYEEKIENLEAYIQKLEGKEKERDQKFAQFVDLQKHVKGQAKIIENLEETIAKLQRDEEKQKKEKIHLESQLAKLRQVMDERARSNPEAERHQAEKEAGEAAALQRGRRAENRASGESATVENSVDVPDKSKRTKETSARPQDEQPGSPSPTVVPSSANYQRPPVPKGKKQGAEPSEKTPAPIGRATSSSRRSVRPLPKNNGKWRDLRHHAFKKTRDSLRAVEIEESEADSEQENEQELKKDKQIGRKFEDQDVSMASDEEVEEAIMPKGRGSEGDEDEEDTSMASDEAESPQRPSKHKGTRERKKLRRILKTVAADDENSSSGDESDAPLTKKDMPRLVADIVKEVLQASTSSPSTTDKKRRRTKRSVNVQLIAEKRADGEGERALYCELVRDTFKKIFSIEYDDEFVTHEAARDEDLEAFFQDDTKGPDSKDLHIDARHKISSSWNKAVIQIMVDAVRKYQAEEEEKFASLPERSEDYIEELVVQRLERLKGIWKKGQAKLKENGEVESPSDVEERMAAERDLAEKTGRAATRRRARYDRRKETLVRMVEIKREEEAQDCFIWEWLLEVVETLGEGGMSSDESDVDERTGQVVYRVNHMPWRREFSKELDYIDKQRKDAHLFSKKGSKPIPRSREGGNESRRPVVEELPKVIYDKGWLEGLPKRFRENFRFSKRPLKWLKIFGKNSGK